MSKNANPGELRTAVYFYKISRSTNDNGFPVETEENVFTGAVMAKWVNYHGSEVWTAMQLNLKDPATLTVRYSPLINERLIVYKASEYTEAQKAGDDLEGDAAAAKIQDALDAIKYEVISIDDVQNRHEWMEVKIQRRLAAR